ncbi:MAG: hemolysin-type calcium-binding protein [Rhodobacteraceae bacterium]|nr:hemolysin-type calcium-binding protein [Paracoccaceae bacterium]
METGFRGTFVISWSQTDVDGLSAAPIESLEVGAAWSWHGEVVRVDGPSGLLRLEGANGEQQLRRRAAKTVRRLVGAAVQNRTDIDQIEVDDPLMDSSFVVTNGSQSYTVTVIEVGPGQAPLLMFLDNIPPSNTDLWVVHHSLGGLSPMAERQRGGVICFTPNTRIMTPDGPKLVQHLREGDRVQTRDNGPKEIMWIGSRRMSGARLYVMPKLRPIRIKAGAFGIDRPEQELLVSPEHRMLVRGQAALDLFNTPEVLVAARELVNGSTILTDQQVREVTYIHLLMEDHQILWANGVETESFHPANAAMSSLDDQDRARLLGLLPSLDRDPHSYGSFARRNLSASEAALFLHEAA